MKIILLDIETTGLSECDEVIEVAAIKCDYISGFNQALSVLDVISMEREPACEISIGAQALHKFKLEDLKGKDFDYVKLRNFFNDASDIIAHYCKFDSQHLIKLFPDLRESRWHCSAMQINWSKEGCVSKRLSYLLNHFGLPLQQHRALSDVKSLKQLLDSKDRSGLPFISQLLK